jgi:hypothetical protein
MRSTVLLSALLGCVCLAPAQATTRALLVGINDYSGTPPKLEGAVNDVEDVDKSLHHLGIATTKLENGSATRQAVVGAYEQLLTASQKGDSIYFHFSGHGISIPDDNGDEADGQDESYLLAPFDETRHPDEQLVDDDLDRLFAAAEDKGVEVVFVADACHSGSPARAVGADPLPTRMYRPKTDPTRPPPLDISAAGKDRSNVIAVGATLDDRTIPELMIDDQPRGALSYAVARAFEGAADLDGDGKITAAEFEIYTRQVVRTLAASKQTPQFDVPDATRLIAVADSGERRARYSSDLPALPVEVRKTGPWQAIATTLSGLQGVKLVDDSQMAALILDPNDGTALNEVRDTVASVKDPAKDFQKVVKIGQLMQGINKLAMRNPLSIEFAPSDDVLTTGTQMSFKVEGMEDGYITVFDVTGSGLVQTLWPLGPSDADPWEDEGHPFLLSASVSPPYGADNFVVVATPDEPTALRALLAQPDSPSPEAIYGALVKTAKDMQVQVGVQAFFTKGS